MTGEVKTCGIPEEILMQDKGFASRVVKAVIPDECIALRFVNKAYREVLTRAETLFWNVYEKNEFQMVDITQPCMEAVSYTHLDVYKRQAPPIPIPVPAAWMKAVRG